MTIQQKFTEAQDIQTLSEDVFKKINSVDCSKFFVYTKAELQAQAPTLTMMFANMVVSEYQQQLKIADVETLLRENSYDIGIQLNEFVKSFIAEITTDKGETKQAFPVPTAFIKDMQKDLPDEIERQYNEQLRQEHLESFNFNDDAEKFNKLLHLFFDLYNFIGDKDKLQHIFEHLFRDIKRKKLGLSIDTGNNHVFGIWSAQGGNGKTTLGKALLKVVDNEKSFYQASNLYGQFNGVYAKAHQRGNVMLCIDELDTKFTKAEISKLKTNTTANSIVVEKKHKEVVDVPNNFTTMIFSNQNLGRYICDKQNERRYVSLQLKGINYKTKNGQTDVEDLLRELINYVPREYSKDEFKKEFFNSEKDSTLSENFITALKYIFAHKADLQNSSHTPRALFRKCCNFSDSEQWKLEGDVFCYDLPNSDFVKMSANSTQFKLRFKKIEQAIKNFDSYGEISMDFDIDQLETKDIAPMIKEIVGSENAENDVEQTNNSQDESKRQDEINS